MNPRPNQAFLKSDLDLERLLEALPSVATLEVCSAFLKSKGLHFSATDWDDMISKRFKTPIEEGHLTIEDLAELVHECEECSSKRVFIFRYSGQGSHPFFESGGREKLLKSLKGWPGMGVRRVGHPSGKPKVIEMRDDFARGQRCVVIKIGAVQTVENFVREDASAKGQITRIYKTLDLPVVNVARLFEDGVLEIRVHRDKDMEGYRGATRAIWSQIADFAQESDFEPLNVHGLLSKMWNPEKRKEFSDRIGVATSTHRNGAQTVLEVRSGKPGSDLGSDKRAMESVERFHEEQDTDTTSCRSAFIWIRADKNSKLEERDIRVHVHGQSNEFSVVSRCRKVDYDRAVEAIVGEAMKDERAG